MAIAFEPHAWAFCYYSIFRLQAGIVWPLCYDQMSATGPSGAIHTQCWRMILRLLHSNHQQSQHNTTQPPSHWISRWYRGCLSSSFLGHRDPKMHGTWQVSRNHSRLQPYVSHLGCMPLTAQTCRDRDQLTGGNNPTFPWCPHCCQRELWSHQGWRPRCKTWTNRAGSVCDGHVL